MPGLTSIFNKLTIILLALQILNLSIYNTDFYDHTTYSKIVNELKDENPIDSFAEMVAEDMIGCPNAFPENNQQESKQKSDLKHNVDFKLFQVDNFAIIPPKVALLKSEDEELSSLFMDNYSFLYCKDINHPPA